MKLATGAIVFIIGIGGAVAGIVKLAGDPIGIGLLLGGIAAAVISWYLIGVHLESTDN